MSRGKPGAGDLAIPHYELTIQGQPSSFTLLQVQKTMDAMIVAPQNRATYFKKKSSNGILVIKIPKTINLKYMYFVNN